jgi:predicted NACHT family NTPase
MSEQAYSWKRFWCPRSGSINLADGGYLCDPSSEWAQYYNLDLVSLEAIADIPCLVLRGEPGIGKSQEMENLKKYTEETIEQVHEVLELNLRSCTNLMEDLRNPFTLDVLQKSALKSKNQLQPPATAGTILTSSPSFSGVAVPSKKRMSSLLT